MDDAKAEAIWLKRYFLNADDPVLFSTNAFHFFIPDAEAVIANVGIGETLCKKSICKAS